jgi:acylphosphatase
VSVKDIVRVRASVRGRVQGVSFRAATKITASSLGLVGWVRNELDSSVLVEAEGEAVAVDRLVAWLNHGPPGARVSGVRVDHIPATGADDRFRILF